MLVNANANSTTFFGFQLSDAPTQTHTTTANGDSWAAAGNEAYFLQRAFDSFNNVTASQGWLNTVAVGTDATFRGFSNSSTSNGAQTLKADFAGTWSLQNAAGAYTLTYAAAPIPEAEGIVLLMAGLGVMGFVARRRRER
ncbi:MAG: hypothetical protein HC793_01030 [Aquincola sp.]|nr:hypothetical protein [Aquincola sp.]